jgi:osmotically-inducible protein OsmY
VFTLLRLIFLPAKVGVGTTKLGVKAGYRAGRAVGVRRLLFFGTGVGVGLLVAPMTGPEARARLRELLEQRRGATGQDLAERVRFELSHSPRTWHLPQPIVEAQGQVVVLRGQVPHDAGRADLGRTAASVAGVAEVDNQVVVVGPGTS